MRGASLPALPKAFIFWRLCFDRIRPQSRRSLVRDPLPRFCGAVNLHNPGAEVATPSYQTTDRPHRARFGYALTALSLATKNLTYGCFWASRRSLREGRI